MGEAMPPATTRMGAASRAPLAQRSIPTMS